MEHIFTIKCQDNSKGINALRKVVGDYTCALGQYYRKTKLEQEVIDEMCRKIYEKENEIYKIKRDLENFFSSKMKRYWEVEITNYSEDRKHKYVKSFLFYPYQYIESNSYLIGLISNDLTKDKGRMVEFSNRGIYLDDFFDRDTTIVMKEMTKDEFTEKLHVNIDEIIAYREKRIAECENK